MISESKNRPKFSETQITTMAHLDIIDGMTGLNAADLKTYTDFLENWKEPEPPYFTRGIQYLMPTPEDYQI